MIMNRIYSTLLAFIIVVALVSGLPVTKNKEEEKKETSSPATPDVETALEYERYLKEVVEALESDPEFRKKLDKTPEADIRSGKIAQELEYVNHHVRNKLDEIKRRELDRLRNLANKEYELANDIDRDHMKISAHLDHKNQHTFEIEDLQKLIKKTSEDLAEADRKRREEFKEYEMQKEFERQSQLKEMNEEQRKKYEQELKEKQEKHNKHEKVHHPGGKAQLEEVWEKQDHMDQEFDPRVFFMIHDVDENGFWDEVEVKALFMKELDKVYKSGIPEDDMRERAEEMERMREHVFKEADVNHDGLISFQEFMDQTKREEFNRDPDWQTVDQQPQYTHEEYLEFERRRQEEIQRLVAQGQLPPHPNMPQGYYPNGQPQVPHYQQQQQQQQAQQPQMHYQSPQQQYQQQQQQYQQQQQQQYLQMQQYQQMQQQQQQQQQSQQYKQPVQQVQFHPNQAYQVAPQQQQAHQPQQQPISQQQVPQANQQPVAQQQQQQPQLQQKQQPQLQQQQQPPQQMSGSKNIPQQMGQQQYIPQQQQPQQQQSLPSNNIPNNIQNVVGQVPVATNQNSQPNQNIPVKN